MSKIETLDLLLGTLNRYKDELGGIATRFEEIYHELKKALESRQTEATQRSREGESLVEALVFTLYSKSKLGQEDLIDGFIHALRRRQLITSDDIHRLSPFGHALMEGYEC